MKILLCAVLFTYFLNLNIDSAGAIRCYSCTAWIGYGDYCVTNVRNNSYPITCPSAYTSCMTVIINNTVTRDCATTSSCLIYQNMAGYRRCSTCMFDFCNDRNKGSTTSTSVSLFLSLVVILFPVTKMTMY